MAAKSLAEVEMSIDQLSKDVADQSAAVNDLADQMRSRAFWFRMAIGVLAVVLVVAIAAASAVLLNNQRQIDANNRKFCPLIEPFVIKPGDAPSTTRRGRQIAESFVKLSGEFGCRS